MVAVILGTVIAIASSPLIRELIILLVRGLEAVGMTTDAAVMTLYWLQAIAIGAGVAIAVAGSHARMDGLRAGGGDWITLLRETLVVAGVVVLWVFASLTWDAFVSVFNTYGATTELPMIALLVLFIAGSVTVRLLRRRRARTPS